MLELCRCPNIYGPDCTYKDSNVVTAALFLESSTNFQTDRNPHRV